LLFGRLLLVDLAHHLLLAGRKLVNVAGYLLLDNGDAVDDLSDRVQIDRYCVEPLLVRSAICNWRGPRS
jgi:hypothetical protein